MSAYDLQDDISFGDYKDCIHHLASIRQRLCSLKESNMSRTLIIKRGENQLNGSVARELYGAAVRFQ